MARHAPRRSAAARGTVALCGVLLVLGLTAAPGSASAGAERQGAHVLRGVQAGRQSCRQLSRGQLGAVGEYAMGRMVGSPSRHEAMDRRMRATAGAAGEAEAHVFLGRRFTGCAGDAAPAAFGSMLGMMGGYSGAAGYGPGMMSGPGARAADHGGWTATSTVLLLLLLVTAAGLVIVVLGRRRPAPGRLA